MRLELVYSGRHVAPGSPAHAHAPAPAELPPREPAPIQFDPATGFSRDGDAVYLTARIGPEAFDGSLVVPDALVVKVLDAGDGGGVVEGRTPVHGPGPIAVALTGLEPGRAYDFELYRELPDDEPA
jgi:hypothetical protein